MPKQKKNKKIYGSIIDDSVYLLGIFGFFVFLPQLTKIWIEKNVTGVSVITWGGMTIGSILWVFYGIVHKQKPIIILNLLLTIVQGSIVLGVLLFSK